MNANVKAPTKLSEAIHMALADQETVEKIPGAVIDMDDWHVTRMGISVDGERVMHCHMCFAGAVMHCRFDLGLKYHRMDDFPEEWVSVFHALDEVRQGYVNTALTYFGHETEKFKDFSVTNYSMDREGFRKQMLEVATMLEEKGL